jgi:hypothetical protein
MATTARSVNMAKGHSKSQDRSATSPGERKVVGPDRVRVEFQIDDLVRELIKERGTLVADLGCNGCSACSMGDTVIPTTGGKEHG